MYVPEPPQPFEGGPPLFLREHELIHSDLPALRYPVTIRIVEVQDWTTPPTSDDDDDSPPGEDDDDSNDPDWFEKGNRYGGRSRPRSFRPPSAVAAGAPPDRQLPCSGGRTRRRRSTRHPTTPARGQGQSTTSR